MARTRRAWSDIRDNTIRPLMREATPSQAHWGDAAMLAMVNLGLDVRYMQMADAHEGWVTNVVTTPLINGEPDYPVPTGADRAKRVIIREVAGGNTVETELRRNDQIGGQVVDSPKAISGLPSCRFIGDLLRLDPPPRGYATTAKVVIEMEAPPLQLTGDSSTLPAGYPVILESVLVWDVMKLAIELEARQSGEDAQMIANRSPGLSMLRTVDTAFREFIQPRHFGRVQGKAYTLGD